MQLLVLKAFLKDFERFRLAQCSAVHLFSYSFATDSMNGKWGHNLVVTCIVSFKRGWSGGAMVLGKLPVPGRPTIWNTVGQGPTALAVSAGGGCLDIFTLIYPFFPLSPSLWETARYRLKYCLKGPLNPKPTNSFKRNTLL